MATTRGEVTARIVLRAFRLEWPVEEYRMREVDATGSTGRDGSAMDSDRGRPDAETVGDGAGFTVGEYYGTKAVFYRGQFVDNFEHWYFGKAAGIDKAIDKGRA